MRAIARREVPSSCRKNKIINDTGTGEVRRGALDKGEPVSDARPRTADERHEMCPYARDARHGLGKVLPALRSEVVHDMLGMAMQLHYERNVLELEGVFAP